MYPSSQVSDPQPPLMQPMGLESLPPFPAAATCLLQLLSREDYEPAELMAIVRVDPMLATELLRLVNSARFARTQPVSGIKHAAALLGSDRLRSFATAVSLRLYLGKTVHQEALARVWRHSLATAACCELLADTMLAARRTPKDTAYVAGLLHDIGCLGMMVLHPQEYAAILACSSEGEGDLRSLETDRFGLDHCTAGEWIARHWKLGPEIEAVALHHHDPMRGGSYATLEITKAGVLLADALGWSSVPGTAYPPVEAVAMLPPHLRESIRIHPDKLYASITERIEIFSEIGTGAVPNAWRVPGTK